MELGTINYFLGRTLQKLGKYPDAEKYFEKACENFVKANWEFCETSVYCHYCLRELHLIKGDRIKADQYTRKAMEIIEKVWGGRFEDDEDFKETIENALKELMI